MTSSRLVVQQAQSALRFEIEKFNNKSDEASSEFFNIDQYEKVVDTSDSFEVTKASNDFNTKINKLLHIL